MKKICFCGNPECKPYSARIRIRHNQFKVGIYHTKCHGFTPLSYDTTQVTEEYRQNNIADLLYPTNESFQDSECIHQHDSFTIN